MRRLGVLLLALLGLGAASLGCAMPPEVAPRALARHCEESPSRPAEHHAAAPACIGCAAVLPGIAAPAPRTAIARLLPRAGVAPPLAGLRPAAAAPPPRPLA